MTEKRFTFHHDVDGIDYIQDETNGFCFICDKLLCSLLNDLSEENNQLKKLLECSREEANDYCEELMGKDEFLRLCKEEIEQLKAQLSQLNKENGKLFADYSKIILGDAE